MAASLGDAERSRAAGLEVLVFGALEAAGIDAAVTTRHGGVSTGPYSSLNLALHVGDDAGAVIENRRRAAGALDASLDNLVIGNQVHGTDVLRVGAADAGRGARSDADAPTGVDVLVTTDPSVVLVTMVADCVPLVLVDPVAQVLATVHAGWRGTVGRVTDAALGAMAALGADRRRVVAGLGPAVGSERYVVGPDVAGAARQALGGLADDVLTDAGPGRWHFDLVGANRRLLSTAGVPDGHIHWAAEVTGSPGPFFSDRQERPCGRFALLARLRPSPGEGPKMAGGRGGPP